MLAFKPVPFKMGQLPGAPPGPGSPAVPPPSPDPLFTGYTGTLGIIETLAVLGITGTAAYLGITSATEKDASRTKQAVGWVAGVGSALLGLLYLGGKSGLNQVASLPAVRVTPV